MEPLNLSYLKTLPSDNLLEVINSLHNIYPASLIHSLFYKGIKYSKEGNTDQYHVNSFLDQQYLNNIHEKIVLENKWSKDEIQTMKKMVQYIITIAEIMEPLKALNIECNIGLSGGAIRDFLNHKHDKIKDLDIIVNPYSSSITIGKEDIKRGYDVIKFQNEYEKIKSIMKTLNIPEFKEDIHSTATLIEQFIFHIVAHSLSTKLTIEKKFPPRGIKKPKEQPVDNSQNTEPIINYINDLLRGVIKLKKDSNNLPVDILISNDVIEAYIGFFDFGICQAFLSYDKIKEHVKDKNNIQDEEIITIINNINLHQNYINDVAYDKLTFLLPNSSLENIENIFNKHLQRIKEKYPNHKLGVINNIYDHNIQEDKQITYTLAMNFPIEMSFKKADDNNLIFLRDLINYTNIKDAVEKKMPFNAHISKKKKI